MSAGRVIVGFNFDLGRFVALEQSEDMINGFTGRARGRSFVLGQSDDKTPVREGERWVLKAKGVLFRL